MTLIQIVFTLSQFLASFFLYSSLPDLMPMHWNINGQIDNYMPKQYAVWLMPLISLSLLIMFKIAPSFDPNKKKYEQFKKEWQILQTLFSGFFAYMQGIIFYTSFYPQTQIMRPLFIGMGILFIVLGNYLSKIRQNYFIGIKIPWTLNDEDNWNKTHRFGAWVFVAAGLLIFAEGFFLWNPAPLIFASIAIMLFLPVIYSYILFRKKR